MYKCTRGFIYQQLLHSCTQKYIIYILITSYGDNNNCHKHNPDKPFKLPLLKLVKIIQIAYGLCL